MPSDTPPPRMAGHSATPRPQTQPAAAQSGTAPPPPQSVPPTPSRPAPSRPAPSRPAPAGPASAAEVAAFLRDVARLLAELGDRETAAQVRAEVPEQRDAPAAVVVVGEKKRGKSSLINALVEYPRLLPVDADIATSVHLTVTHAPEPSARVVDGETPRGREIPLTEIAEYAALDPMTQRPRHENVLHVTVGLPHPLLARGICLMDTPGVGGLLAGHTAITLGAATEADALIFVVDGSSELTASECAFLKRVSGRVATVLFVLAQIDLYPDWQAVLDRNGALVAEHAPRYRGAPWFPVSSRMRVDAIAAAAAGRHEIAARRRERSRFAPLETALVTTVADRADAVRLGNLVQIGTLALDSTAAAEQTRLEALAGDPQLAEQVRAERDRLRGMQQQTAAWRKGLMARFRALETRLRRDFHGQLDALVTDAQTKIATGGKDVVKELPGEVEAAVTGLWMDVQYRMHTGITEIIAELAVQLDVGRQDVGDGAVLRARLRRLPPLVRSQKQGSSPVDVAARVAPTSALLSFGAASIHLLAGFALPIVGVGAGLQAVAQMRRATREGLQRHRGDGQRYVQSVAKYVSADVPAAIHDTMEASYKAITQEVAARIVRRIKDAETALALHERALAAEAAELTARRNDAQGRLERLTALRRHGADLTRRVRTPRALHAGGS